MKISADQHRVEFHPLTRRMALRAGIDGATWDHDPHVAWVGLELAPKARGWRSIKLEDGKRYRMLGMGGLVWREGLCWLWLHKIDMKRTSAVKVVRSARAMIRKAAQLGETQIVAARDVAPRSEKLLVILGFERVPDHPALLGRELWKKNLR